MNKRTNLALCLLLALGIFLADAGTPLGIAVGALYTLVVTLSSFSDSRNGTVFLSALCSCFLVVGVYTSLGVSVPLSLAVTNRLIFLMLIWLICGFVIRGQRMRRALTAREAELGAANAKLEILALCDGLTGLPNRRCFDGRLAVEWRRAERDHCDLGLIMIDIDFFKSYNDTLGHPAGDACLAGIAKTLGAELRRPGDFVARYGGEEFIAILPETGPPGALKRAEAVRRAIESMGIQHPANPLGAVVTTSIGVASAIPGEDGFHAVALLVEAADQALYAAKQEGRNRVRASFPGTSRLVESA